MVNDIIFVFVIFMNNFAAYKTNIIHYGVKNKRYMQTEGAIAKGIS